MIVTSQIQNNIPIKNMKNKTHRIMSMSPSQHSSLKPNSTPVKILQANTRANTHQVEQFKSAGEKQRDEVVVSGYRDSNGMNKMEERKSAGRSHLNVDEILIKIGKQFQSNVSANSNVNLNLNKSVNKNMHLNLNLNLNANSNTSQLFKKTQISHLRDIIEQAKITIKQGQQKQLQNCGFLQNIITQAHQEIISYFKNLQQVIKNKQNQILHDLELRKYEIEQKSVIKSTKLNFLSQYIQKCQRDITNNYDGIINQLDSQQLVQIVQKYKTNINYYSEQIKTNYSVQLKNTNFNFKQEIQKVQVELVAKKCPKNEQKNEEEQQKFESRISIDLTPINAKLKGHKGTCRKSNFEGLLNLSKIDLNKNKEGVRIFSARGKY